MSLYDRIFRPRRYTLSDGTVVEEKRSRAPLVILILVLQPERLKELRRWIGMRRKLPQV